MHSARTASFSVIAATLFALPLAAQQQALQVNWVQSPINNNWYALDDVKRSWQEAENMAVSLGGHLATIRSQAEQTWITDTFWTPYAHPKFWIGLNDIALEGQFVWSSGESVSYLNWAANEPNNLNNEDGVIFEVALPHWNDVNVVGRWQCLYEIETDCNGNNQDDLIDIQTGQSLDCNGNGRPDECDVLMLGNDLNLNGVLDACESTVVGVSPALLHATLGGWIDVDVLNVPDGPAEIVLGSLVLPTVVTNGSAQVLVPPLGYASAVDVSVGAAIRWNDGQSILESDPLPNAFTWNVPEVASVTPNAVPFDVPSAVVIQLADNVVTSGLGLVRFGAAAPAVGVWFTFGGATLVSVVSPPQLAPGTYPIELQITSGGVTEYTRVEGRAIVHLGPGIVAQSAISGFQGGGDVVAFGLVDFEPGVPIEVAFGSATTSGVPAGFLAQSTLSVTTPLSSVAGVVDVTLTQAQPGGGLKVAVSPGAFEFLPPIVGALTSVSGPQAGGEIVDIATSGFATGPIDVHMGGVVALGSVLGTGANQIATFVTPAATASGPSSVRLEQGVFDVTAPETYEFLAPSVASVTPADAAWYEPQDLVIQGAHFAPNVPADVVIESGAPLAATVVSPTEVHVTLPAEHLAGAGPLDITVVQSTVSATAPDAFTCLPSLDVTVIGSAALGGQVRFDIASRQGGFAIILVAAFESPLPLTLADVHHAAYLDPLTFVWLATGGLLTSPTFTANFAAGKLAPGSQIPAQSLAFEFGPFGARNGFTQLVTIEVP